MDQHHKAHYFLHGAIFAFVVAVILWLVFYEIPAGVMLK